MKTNVMICFLTCMITSLFAQKQTARALGVHFGVLPTGKYNAITDVSGVKVGHSTIIKGTNVRTGVTVVTPHQGNVFQQKVPAGIYVGNGFGKLTGSTQVAELGTIETPIVLTNTLSVATGIDALVDYTIHQPGNENVFSVNAVVGETNDGYLNDIRGQHVQKQDILNAIQLASSGEVAQGSVGAGTGTVCFNFKGGIGTSSRKLPANLGGYTVGVIVQTNFGGVLEIDGVAVGEALNQYYLYDQLSKKEDGSCMIVVATDAPLDSRSLTRLAKRAFMGLAKTGGIAHNGSGDYVIAFSTDSTNRVNHIATQARSNATFLTNDAVSPLFLAAIEATEEAIINSLFMSTTTKGNMDHTAEALPVEKILSLLKNKNK
jgi:D-aminopeptidase